MLAAVQELLNDCLKESAGMGVWSWVPLASGFVVAVLALVLIDACLSGSEPDDSDDQVASPSRPGETARDSEGGRGGAGAVAGVELAVRESSGERDTHGDWHDRRMHRSASEEDDGVQLIASPSVGPVGSAAHHTTSGEDSSAPSREEVRRAKLLVFALAVQHIPEALAMGVAFAAAAQPNGNMGAAISLTIAIGLQDIPEGMAAALVLRRLDYSRRKSFFWGQATGWVQPISGIIGAVAVLAVKAALPYALAFAGAAMLFVIIRDMVPDCITEADRLSPTVLAMLGFVVMTVTSMLFEELVDSSSAAADNASS